MTITCNGIPEVDAGEIAVTCPTCQGERMIPNMENTAAIICPTCAGQGEIPQFEADLLFQRLEADHIAEKYDPRCPNPECQDGWVVYRANVTMDFIKEKGDMMIQCPNPIHKRT